MWVDLGLFGTVVLGREIRIRNTDTDTDTVFMTAVRWWTSPRLPPHES